MRYLLDTCLISDFIKNEPGTVATIKQTLPVDIAVSSITVMELRYGLRLNPQRVTKIEPVINSFLDAIAVLPFGVEEGNHAAQIRAVLKPQGRPIGAYDVLIASTALPHNLIMVTANLREFECVSELRVESWRQ